MSYIGSAVRRIFGHAADQATRLHAAAGKNTQMSAEALVVGTVARKMKGPTGPGSAWSAFIRVPAAGGAG